MYKHILIPTDGSELSRKAAMNGVKLAQALGASVTAFFAAPAPTPLVYEGFLPVGYTTLEGHAEIVEKTAARYLGVIERACRLEHHAQGRRRRERARLRDALGEVVPVNVFHDQERHALRFIGVMSDHDVGMLQGGDGFRLTLEALEDRARLAVAGMQHLQANVAAHAAMPGLENRSHAPLAQFFKQNVPLMVAKVLAETGLDPWLLDLELTESIVMHNADAVSKDLKQLRELGVGISIDDFGTRYSTLAYVKHFPVDRLKIDQCFVRDIATNPSDAAIVRAIVSLGHSLDLEIVAEGVETLQQTTMLRAEGCDEVQGFYFAGPMSAEDLISFVRENRARARSA